MNKINVGVIGIGNMGYNHARVYSELENVNLIGLSDVINERSLVTARKYNCVNYNDYEKLLNNTDLDVISICVPTKGHYEVVMDAIEHEKHVLVEKPISFSIKEANKMINGAKKAGVKLSIGHVERFNPVVIKSKSLIKSGVIGEIVSASAKRLGPTPPRIADVGVTIDLAIHDIDVLSFLFEIPVAYTYANMSNIIGYSGHEDHSEIFIKYNNGTIGILEANWLTPFKKRKLEITGTDGIISIDYIYQSLCVHGKFAQDIEIKHEEPLKLELQSFINSVITDKSPLVTGSDGRMALKVALAAIKSNDLNRPVFLD